MKLLNEFTGKICTEYSLAVQPYCLLLKNLPTFKFYGRGQPWETMLKAGITINLIREEKMWTNAKMIYHSWKKLIMPWQMSLVLYWFFMSKYHSLWNTYKEYWTLGKDTTSPWRGRLPTWWLATQPLEITRMMFLLTSSSYNVVLVNGFLKSDFTSLRKFVGGIFSLSFSSSVFLHLNASCSFLQSWFKHVLPVSVVPSSWDEFRTASLAEMKSSSSFAESWGGFLCRYCSYWHTAEPAWPAQPTVRPASGPEQSCQTAPVC